MKLVYDAIRDADDALGGVILTSPRDGRTVRLNDEEFALARLFDGTRTLDVVLAQFWGNRRRRLSPEALMAFLHSLGSAGLLEATDDREAEMLFGSPASTHGRRESSGGGSDARLEHSLVGRRRGRRKSDLESSPRKFKILIPLPVRWLMPIGEILLLPMRNRFMLYLSTALMLVALYGLWVNRVDAMDDFGRLLQPLTFLQVLMLSMVTVNLLGQAARAAAFRKRTGALPGFGIALLFYFIPRFMTDPSQGPKYRSIADAQFVTMAALCSNFVLLTGSAGAWFLSKDSVTAMPAIFMALTVLSIIRLLLNLNPFAQRPGYYLLTSKLGTPNLRGRAIAAVVGERGRLSDRRGRRRGDRREKPPSTPWLWLYGLGVLLWSLTVIVLVTMFAFGWLSRNWGGLGVIIFLVVIGVFALGPRLQRRRQAEPAADVRRSIWPRLRVRPVFVVSLCMSALLWAGLQPYTYEVSGDVSLMPAQRAQVQAMVAGQVVRLYAEEGREVRRGQVLAVLSADEEQRSLTRAQAALEGLRADLERSLKGASDEQLALARQAVETARTRGEVSRKRLQRVQDLGIGAAISAQDLEDARREAALDEESHQEALRRLDILLAGSRPETIARIEASIAKTEAMVRYHASQLSKTGLKSPIDGQVISNSLRFAAGDHMDRGDSLAIVEETSTLNVEIVVAQDEIGEVHGGDPVEVKLRALPDVAFRTRVLEISPSAQHAEREKVFRATASIPNVDRQLKVGMSGVAKIQGREEAAFLAFSRWLNRAVRVELWAWLP